MNKVLVVILVILLVVVISGGIVIYTLAFKDKDEVKTFSFDPGDVFITNLKDSDSLIKVDLILEVKQEKKTEQIMTENNYKIRDSVICVLRKKTKADMNKADYTETLKKDIIDQIKKDLSLNEILEVYFQEIIVQ